MRGEKGDGHVTGGKVVIFLFNKKAQMDGWVSSSFLPRGNVESSFLCGAFISAML